MGIFTGGDKNWRDAGILSAASDIEEQEMRDRAQRRSFLQDIRQARIAQAYNEWAASSSDEYVTTSGTAAATGNIFSNFSGAYRYSIQQSEALASINATRQMSQYLEKRAAKMDKRAATAAKYVTAGAQIAGYMIGGPVGGAVGGAVGAGTVAAMGGGKAARRAANEQAVEGGFQMLRQYTKSDTDTKDKDKQINDNYNRYSKGGISRSGGYNESSYYYSKGGKRSSGYNYIPGGF